MRYRITPWQNLCALVRRAISQTFVALLVLLVAVSLEQTAFANSDKNTASMVGAARKLTWDLPENRAFLLVKNETIESPVAVIFGYADNSVACDEIAKKLSVPMSIGTFKCVAIY